MKWKVSKTGFGSKTYDEVQIGQGGSLVCFELRGQKPYEGASSEFEVRVPVAMYGPGMWVTAELQEES